MDISQIKVWTFLIVPFILTANNRKFKEVNNILSNEEVMKKNRLENLKCPLTTQIQFMKLRGHPQRTTNPGRGALPATQPRASRKNDKTP